MLNIIGLVLAGSVLAAIVGKFFISLWGLSPPQENSSRTDWASLTGGGPPGDHHGGSDHGNLP